MAKSYYEQLQFCKDNDINIIEVTVAQEVEDALISAEFDLSNTYRFEKLCGLVEELYLKADCDTTLESIANGVMILYCMNNTDIFEMSRRELLIRINNLEN